ncbi:glutathione S-transferase family protein [Ruegeria jejuensis]|uniref:glutathione S-transferase family protein n=1 Tax=Ruegeria jejuensis TaxID=3233338 RepID=UPI00355BBCA8
MKPYRLINRLGSGGFVVEAALTLADIPFELDLIASDPSSPLPDQFRDLNPWGQVPVLTTPEGAVLTECAAILFYLAERHRSLRYGPNLFVEDVSRFYRWTSFLATNVYEGILRKSYPDRYAIDPSIPQEQLRNAIRTAARARTHRALHLIENELADSAFLCGMRLSPADIFLAMLSAWHNPQPDLPRCNAVTEFVANQEQIAEIWFRNFDHRLDHRWQDE